MKAKRKMFMSTFEPTHLQVTFLLRSMICVNSFILLLLNPVTGHVCAGADPTDPNTNRQR